jgi:hypothetical protein
VTRTRYAPDETSPRPRRNQPADPGAICTWCHVAPPVDGQTRCAICRQKARDYAKAQADRRRAERLCLTCAAPLTSPGRLCDTHREYYRVRALVEATRAKVEGGAP